MVPFRGNSDFDKTVIGWGLDRVPYVTPIVSLALASPSSFMFVPRELRRYRRGPTFDDYEGHIVCPIDNVNGS